MTHDLQVQQRALKTASEEAEFRRQFIETVLAGVSAGVLGLDAEGAISAANQPAHALLELGEDAIGRPLADAAPELLPIAAARRRRRSTWFAAEIPAACGCAPRARRKAAWC